MTRTDVEARPGRALERGTEGRHPRRAGTARLSRLQRRDEDLRLRLARWWQDMVDVSDRREHELEARLVTAERRRNRAGRHRVLRLGRLRGQRQAVRRRQPLRLKVVNRRHDLDDEGRRRVRRPALQLRWVGVLGRADGARRRRCGHRVRPVQRERHEERRPADVFPSFDGRRRHGRRRARTSPQAPVGANNLFPAIVARGTGDVRIAWQDDRNGFDAGGDDEGARWNTYYRSSTDGGAAWSPEVKLSAFVPATATSSRSRWTAT